MDKRDFTSLIGEGNLKELFIGHLGWNRPRRNTPILLEVGDKLYRMSEIAVREGFQIVTCQIDHLPPTSMLRRIDVELRKQAADYILIFLVEGHPGHQQWVVPVKNVDKRDLVTVEFSSGAQADFLYSKIDAITFPMGAQLTIVDVKEAVHRAFLVNSEKITKEFYAKFKKHHKEFAALIQGIDDLEDRDWYSSVMLNRLMFCYFIQKKGFLDDDKDYLSNKLRWVQEERGANRFYHTFYKGFLTKLFSDGLNKPQHDIEFERQYGQIPYLNGGMFDKHKLERDYPDIDIPDLAFANLFDFFNKWQWHLDTRITATGRDINPDVLGYIFEQYINDRAQMGAYYTKEDITEYIGRNTIVPFLLDKAARANKKMAESFDPQRGWVWEMLRNSGKRYIFDAVQQGHTPNWREEIPEEISVGILRPEEREEAQLPVTESHLNLLERRRLWNTPTPAPWALPTEIWRETIERLERCDDILGKIRNGEIHSINDFITYNLDIRQFATDLIAEASKRGDVMWVYHFYDALRTVTILDPTCGSGAFLFAAMNILEPLYYDCIQILRAKGQNIPVVKVAMDEISAHYRSNDHYFIFKSIILRNLYGVDIMAEATEIAKLRLFLKMVAVVDADPYAPNLGLDPLPDIDFNIRCGNTLVGYANEQAVIDADPGNMFAQEEYDAKIKPQMVKIAAIYRTFRDAQLSQAPDQLDVYKKNKLELKLRLDILNKDLNHHLYKHSIYSQFGYKHWLASHQPFHWIAEFYEIINDNGGFDVIIGNPPYVVYNKATFDYLVTGFNTLECRDLYAMVIERSLQISKNISSFGMILPISANSTDGFLSLRNILSKEKSTLYYSNYSMRPSKLFEGAEKRLCILLGRPGSPEILSSKYYRWYSVNRERLFKGIEYTIVNKTLHYLNTIPKISTDYEKSILSKILSNSKMSMYTINGSEHVLYHTRKLGYFVQFLDTPPKIYDAKNKLRVTSELKTQYFSTEDLLYRSNAIYLSDIFFWFFIGLSDCRNLNNREVESFPLDLMGNDLSSLFSLGKLINEDLQRNSVFVEAEYKKYGRLSMQTFKPRLSKPIIDEIDKVLAEHYGFTEEELDFIINYDIKYRMGDELNNDDTE